MNFRLLLISSLLSFSLAYAGTKEDIEQVQRNLLEMQRQFWDLEKEIKANSAAVQSAVKKLDVSAEEMRDQQAALNAKLESILNQIQALHEKLNETNQRIRELSITQQAPVPAQAMPAEQRSAMPSEQKQPPSQETSPPIPAQPRTAATIGEQQLLQEATAFYSQGRYEQALRGFQDLLDQYPKSRLAADAQFMIGESYYGMKEYVDAVTEYDKVINGFPDSERVPGARLRKATSLFSLGKKGQGVIELQQIVERYPNSKEAQMARQRLSELGLD